jgi:hypothetical protein
MTRMTKTGLTTNSTNYTNDGADENLTTEHTEHLARASARATRLRCRPPWGRGQTGSSSLLDSPRPCNRAIRDLPGRTDPICDSKLGGNREEEPVTRKTADGPRRDNA